MTADELRAKFEVWWQRLLQTPGGASYNSQMPAEGDYRGIALLAYQAAYATLLRERESAKAGFCRVCGSDEPHTGTCGSNDPRALCNATVAPHLASARVPDGWMLVPKMFGIPADAWHAAQFAFGGPGTGDDEPFMDCTAWIGELTGDEGEKIQGLHIWCDECPEEGSITLAEFPAAPKPTNVWPMDAREKAFSWAREMLQKGSAKPEKE